MLDIFANQKFQLALKKIIRLHYLVFKKIEVLKIIDFSQSFSVSDSILKSINIKYNIYYNKHEILVI